jgi:hypothetical protein
MLIWFPENLGVLTTEEVLLRKEVCFCEISKNHMKNMARGLWCRFMDGYLFNQTI